MLNEIFTLSNTIAGMGIEPDSWNREYLLLPNQPCYRIWISSDGSVCGFEELNGDLLPHLRKYGNNQRSFPATNIKPLYRIVDEGQKKWLKQIEDNASLFDFETIRPWCIQDNWRGNLINIDRSLRYLGSEISSMISKQGLDDQNIITQLSLAVERLDGGLKASLERHIFEKLSKNEDVGLLLKVLFHSGDPNKEPAKDVGNNISVILDLDDWQDFGYPVASEHTTRWLNTVLLKDEELKSEKDPIPMAGKDAFGSPHDGVQDPMPKVKLGAFDVSLRSMFREQPCQYRYGKIESDSYPISKSNRANIKRSLEWIAQPYNEGVYWKKADKSEIVYVYPSKIPKVPLKYAGCFGRPDDRGDGVEKRFAPIAEDFIRALKGLPPTEKPDNIQIFSIRKMDRARSKVIFTRNLTPEWLIYSAEEWMQGCNNTPVLESIIPTTPFPLQVASVVNNVWNQEGKLASAGKTTIKRMQCYQGMELLLDNVRDDGIRYYLHILISNSIGLIKHFGGEDHNRYSLHSSDKTKENTRVELSSIVSVFGLLLYKGGIKVDNYLETTPYLVGQLLKISDELHTFYCKVVRDGDVPPQLAGNSVFMSASETPARALAQLSTRMSPYIAWAKQYRTKNIISDVGGGWGDKNKGVESWRAAWYLSMYEDVATSLNTKLTESTRFSDFEKAQMFFGYLARFPKRERYEKDNENTTNDRDVMGAT